MIGMPNWLRQEDDMTQDHDDVHVPKVARIEPRAVSDVNKAGYVWPRGEQKFDVHPQAENSIPPVDRDEAIAKAAATMVANQRELEQELNETRAARETLRRKLVDSEFEVIDLKARLVVAENSVVELMQENSDLRAGSSESLAMLKHLVGRMEGNGILPPRKKNGNLKQKALQETTTKNLQEEIKREG